jgi:hypothetical protein
VDSQTQTTTAAARPSVRGGLTTAVTICTVTLLIATFELSMADWPSSLVEMLLLPLTALVFLGCSVRSLTHLLRIRRGGAKFAGPFLVLRSDAGDPDLRSAAGHLSAMRLPLAPRRPRSDRGADSARRAKAECRL